MQKTVFLFCPVGSDPLGASCRATRRGDDGREVFFKVFETSYRPTVEDLLRVGAGAHLTIEVRDFEASSINRNIV